MKKFNYINILIFLMILICSFFASEYRNSILIYIKPVLSSHYVFWIITVSVLAIKLISKFKYRELKFSSIIDVEKFNDNVTEIISLFVEPSTIICSLSIIKGLVLDYFYGDTYFFKFNDYEKFFILIASIYFFFFAYIKIHRDFMQIVMKTETIQ